MASVIGPTPLRYAVSAALNVVCAAEESAVDALCAERLVRSYDVPHEDGAALAWLYQHGDVVTRTDDETFAHMVVRLDPIDAGRFEQRAQQRDL